MELHFTRTNGPVDDLIDRLIRHAGDVRHPDYVREMILTSLKSGQESEDLIDLKIMNSTLKEMRFTTKVFSPYRGVRKVTVFGSARTRRTHLQDGSGVREKAFRRRVHGDHRWRSRNHAGGE